MFKTQTKAIYIGLLTYVLAIIGQKFLFAPLNFGLPFYFTALCYGVMFFLTCSDGIDKGLRDSTFSKASFLHILGLLICISIMIFCMYLNQHEIVHIGWLWFVLIFFAGDFALLMMAELYNRKNKSKRNGIAYTEAKATVNELIAHVTCVDANTLGYNTQMNSLVDDIDLIDIDFTLDKLVAYRYGVSLKELYPHFYADTPDLVKKYFGLKPDDRDYPHKLKELLPVLGKYYELYEEIIRQLRQKGHHLSKPQIKASSFSEARQLVNKAIQEVFGNDANQYSDNSSLVNDLGADVLDFIELDDRLNRRLKEKYGLSAENINNIFAEDKRTKDYLDIWWKKEETRVSLLESIFKKPVDYYVVFAEIINILKIK